MRINSLIKSFSLIIILCVFPSSLFSTDLNTIDDFFNKYKFESDDIENMRRLKDESQAQSLYNSAYTGIGYSKPLKDFLSILYSTEHYAPQIEYISRTVPSTTINRGYLTAATKARVLTGYREFHDFNETKLTKNVTKMFEYASYFQIAYLTFEAFNGNDKAKLEVLKAAYNLRHGQMMTAIGINPVFGVLIAVIDLALTWAIQSTFDTYNELYYNAYHDYLETKYGDIHGWVNLAVSGNRAAFDARLNEFWGEAEYHVNNYVIDHPEYRSIWGRAGSAIAVGDMKKYKEKYFMDRLARPLSNRMIQIAKQQRLNHRREVEILLFDLKRKIEEIKWLQVQLDNITILDPDEVEYTAEDIKEIFISPSDATIKQGSSIDISVTAILKGEEGTLVNVTNLAPIFPKINSIKDELGEHTLKAEYLGQKATAKVKVITDPVLSIEPTYKEIDVNQSDRRVTFTASFSDEIGIITDVTDDAFSIYGTNEFPFENVGKQNIGISYTYQGNVYYAEAIINVVGCNNPEQVQNNNGDCVCDEARGYFATSDPDVCSVYEIVKFEPDRIESFVGDVVVLNAVGIDKNGVKTILEPVEFDVNLRGNNTYNHYIEWRMITAIISGVECDGTTDEEWNVAQGTCDCIDGYTRNNDGICVPNEEIDDETEYDCSTENIESLMELVAILIADYKYWETELLGYINQFNKEINDQTSNPCNNSIIAYCYSNAIRIAAELDESKNDIVDTVAEILVINTVCNDIDQLLSGSGIPVMNLISSVNGLDSYQEPLNQMKSRLLENGCDEQEVAETGEKAVPPEEDPGFVQEGGTFTTGNSGSIPGGGTGTASDVYVQCMNAKGVDIYNMANIMNDLNAAFYQAADVYYDDDNHDPNKCYKFKNAINNYLEFSIKMRDCIIEAGPTLTNYQQQLNAAQLSIDYYNDLIASLGC